MVELRAYIGVYQYQGGTIIPIWIMVLAVTLNGGAIFSEKVVDRQNSSSTAAGRVLGVKTQKSNDTHPIEAYLGRSDLNNLDNMVEELSLTIYPEDKVTAFPRPELGLGSIIRIQRALPVKVVDQGKENIYRTWAKSVGNLLNEQNIDLGEKDMVNPAVETPLVLNTIIIIVRVAETDIKQILSIPYNTIVKKDPNLDEGISKTTQTGKTGSREKIFHIRRENGVEVQRILISDKVIVEPVDQIIVKGTKPRIKLISSGAYKDIINAAAKKYGINATAIYCLMMAESNGHYNSVGYVNGVPTYFGLFQYRSSTWSKYSRQAGYSGASIYDPTAQINVTTWVLKNIGGWSWGPWGGCAKK